MKIVHRLRMEKKLFIKQLFLLSSSFLLAFAAYANPVLNNIGAGSVNIRQTQQSTIVNQSTRKAIINWQQFNIGKNEFTHFQQPRGGITLNRISAADGVSQIFGRLSATGKIILINPAGIYFGPSSFVSVGGLIATTADLSDQNFLKGNYQFTQVPGYSGVIENEGKIIAAKNGLVALVAPGVVNKGRIVANLGQVILGSGEAFVVNFSGDGLVNFAITQKTSRPGVDRNGRPLRDGVKNTGSLIANGGKVLVTAQAASGVLDNVINMEGVAQARSVSMHNGEIIFSGDPEGGVVRVAAKVDASGKKAGQKGGKVSITGEKILVEAPTVIDVSGRSGGGEIQIGGNYKGEGPLPNAKAVVVMPETTLLADATKKGDGGTIIVWSDEVTKAYGDISARGGILGGDGGFVETSSHNYLDAAGIKVDTRAPKGEIGTWLLDPRDVFITTAATTGGTFDGGNPNIFTPSSDDSNILNTDIMNNLALTDVTITTGATGVQDGNISVNAPITWASNNALSLEAANKIFLNADITGTNGTLNLTAINTPQSITSGTAAAPSSAGVTANIDVASFRLLQGEWFQNTANLPAFNVTDNFHIAAGTAINTVFNASFARFAGGNGGASPFLITDKYGLEGMATLNLFNNYNLINNIDLAGTSGWHDGLGFQPITPVTNDASTALYRGNFDGQFHTISNLTMTTAADSNFGLFTDAGTPGSIQNLTIYNANLTQTNWGLSNGILVGANHGAIFGAGATINNINVIDGVIFVTPTLPIGFSNVGGLIGYNNGPVSNVSSSATVIANNGDNQIGGLIGSNNGAISNAASYGVVGFSDVATGNAVGGFVGSSSGPFAIISDSLSTANVNSSMAGNTFGGFAAANSAPIVNSFWNITTSGQATSAGGTGKTDAEMKSISTFSGAGWDIGLAPSSATWNIVESVTYPFLSSMTAAVTIKGPSAGVPVNLVLDGNFLIGGITGVDNTFLTLLPVNQIILASSVPVNTNTVFSVDPYTFNTQTLVPNQLTLNSSTTPFSNALLSTVKGDLLPGYFVYSLSGNDLTLDPGISLAAAPGTTYRLDGDITGDSSLFFRGLNVTTDAVLSASNIILNNFVIGDDNLTLQGTGSSNTLALNTHSTTQRWAITGTDIGRVTGLSGFTGSLVFNNFQNLAGGTISNNNFVFTNNSSISGLVNGGSLAHTNTLNYILYNTPIQIILSSPFAGNVLNNGTNITTFVNINQLIANSLNSNSITLPNISNNVTITGFQKGTINPLSFVGFNTLISTSGTDSLSFSIPSLFANSNSVTIDGSSMFFNNFNLNNASGLSFVTSDATVAGVVQQPSTEAADMQQSNQTFTSISTTVDTNITELLEDLANEYNSNLDTLTINPFCAG